MQALVQRIRQVRAPSHTPACPRTHALVHPQLPTSPVQGRNTHGPAALNSSGKRTTLDVGPSSKLFVPNDGTDAHPGASDKHA
jgi:hypothetical protein